MIEIIVGVWLTCFCLALCTVAFGYYLTQKKLNSRQLAILNQNLSRVGLYWSTTNGEPLPIPTAQANAIELDRRKTLRHNILIGALGLASIPGLLLLWVVFISMHMMPRSRQETTIFNSPLAQDSNLQPEYIQSFLDEYKKRHG